QRCAQLMRHAGQELVLGLNGSLQFIVLFLQRLLEMLALSSIFVSDYIPCDPPCPRPDWRRLGAHPADSLLGAPQTELTRITNTIFDTLRPSIYKSFPIVRVYRCGPSLPHTDLWP